MRSLWGFSEFGIGGGDSGEGVCRGNTEEAAFAWFVGMEMGFATGCGRRFHREMNYGGLFPIPSGLECPI